MQITKFGDGEAFKKQTLDSKPLESNSVRVKVHASGVNFADLMMRMGLYPEAPPLPFVPGYELAGIITEVGPAVTAFALGDRVLAGTRFGAYTTEICLPAHQVRKTPSYLSDTEAAAIPVNFLTAWVALEELARVRARDRVLIQSAAGGVGLAAFQVARDHKAIVTGLVSSSEKKKILKEMGIDEALTYEEYEQRNHRFDIILDAQGGSGLKKSYQRLSSAGRVVTFGASQVVSGSKRSWLGIAKLTLQTPFYTPYKLMTDNKGVFGLNLLPLMEELERDPSHFLGKALDQILAKFESKEFQVRIGKTFPLEQAALAHAYLQDRSTFGKVVLTC